MQQPHLCYSFCHFFSHLLNHLILRRYDRRVVKALLGYLVTCVDTVTSPCDGWWHKCKEASFYPEEVQTVTFFCKGFVARIGTEWRDEREQRRNDRCEPHRPVEPWMKSRPTGRSASLIDDRWRNDVRASGFTWKHHDFVGCFHICAERDGRRRLVVLADFLDTTESNCNSSKVRLPVLILAPERPLGVRRGETAPPVLEMCELQRN